MLSQDQVMPLLLEACPSFGPVWNAQLGEEDRKLLYVCLGTFAKHLLDLKQEGRDSEFTAVVHVIERLHLEGDSSTQVAATIGLLEAVQNIWGNNGVATDDFEEMLLPESRLWWGQLELFWAGAIPYVGATMPNKECMATEGVGVVSGS